MNLIVVWICRLAYSRAQIKSWWKNPTDINN